MSPELHGYQHDAVRFLRSHDEAWLMLDMGLGKTAVVLRALEARHLPVLVVSTKRIVEEVWAPEVDKWRPDLSISVAAGTPAKRAAALEHGADVTAISFDNAADAVAAGPFRTLVIDETSAVKNRATLRWSTLRDIRRAGRPAHVWGLTGTPAPRGLLDLFPQAYILDGGKSLGTKITAFRGQYFTAGRRLPNGTVISWDERPGAHEEIMARLDGLALSISTQQAGIDLPPVTINDVLVRLPPGVMDDYRRLKRDMVMDLRDLGIYTAASRGVLAGRLSQLASGIAYDADPGAAQRRYLVAHREKVRVVREIVEGTDGPVLVLTGYRAELDMLRDELGDLVHDDTTADLQRRWNAGDLPVLAAHPASIGHGLNLQLGPGHTAVWLTLPWSLEHWAQTNKRLARQGQRSPVVVHRILAAGTVDEQKVEVLAGRAREQDAILAHFESPL